MTPILWDDDDDLEEPDEEPDDDELADEWILEARKRIRDIEARLGHLNALLDRIQRHVNELT